jgi:chromosome segregation ATPase
LTPEQTSELRETISSRQKVLDAMEVSVEKDELEVSVQDAAIERLEDTISLAEQDSTTQKGRLSSLEQVHENLQAANANRPDWATLSEVSKHYEITFADIDDQLNLSTTKLGESIAELKEYIRRLSSCIQEMENELSNRQYMRDTLSQYISDTRKHKAAIEKNMTILKSMFNNVRHIPAEIWAKIFSLRVHEDMAEFFVRPRVDNMPMTILKLSHVSRFWRTVALSHRRLWQFVPVYHRDSWPLPRLELLRCLVWGTVMVLL